MTKLSPLSSYPTLQLRNTNAPADTGKELVVTMFVHVVFRPVHCAIELTEVGN